MKKLFMIFFLFMIFWGLFFVFGDEFAEQEEQPWEWNLEKVKSMVGKVRAGRDLTPEIWPEGARVAVALSFDFDAETNALRDKNISPSARIL